MIRCDRGSDPSAGVNQLAIINFDAHFGDELMFVAAGINLQCDHVTQLCSRRGQLRDDFRASPAARIFLR